MNIRHINDLVEIRHLHLSCDLGGSTAGPERPYIVFLSTPCKGFSTLLSKTLEMEVIQSEGAPATHNDNNGGTPALTQA